jgi:hypothetical protein
MCIGEGGRHLEVVDSKRVAAPGGLDAVGLLISVVDAVTVEWLEILHDRAQPRVQHMQRL